MERDKNIMYNAFSLAHEVKYEKYSSPTLIYMTQTFKIHSVDRIIICLQVDNKTFSTFNV